MYKQIIIARKDLNLSPGKLAAQCCHGSMAFLLKFIRKNTAEDGRIDTWFDDLGVLNNWIKGIFTKVILQAKNKNQLLKAKTMAKELGMKEGEDFFCIYDCCLTELEPEEDDGTTLTCIGFKPMEDVVIDQIGQKFHTYVG